MSEVPGDVVGRAKAALEGVTPGPWEWNFPEGRGDDSLKSTTHITPYHGGHVHDGKSGHPTEVIGAVWHNDDTAGIAGEPADLAFIAAARSLIPELVAEIERLRFDADHFTKQLQDSLDPGGGDEWDADDVIAIVRDLEADVERLRERLPAVGGVLGVREGEA